MQNRYTGDIGDFGKLGLLRVLQSSGLTIGVNWYLAPDETHNGDGRHVKYLEQEDFRECDELLWFHLRDVVCSGRREVQALQNDNILKATFFSDPLQFARMTKAGRNMARASWHRNALKKLAGTDIVFADPDNGLIVPSAAGTVRENKYVLPGEIADYYDQGSSVIYYQHKARRQDPFYIDQHNELIKCAALNGASGVGLKFKTTSQRYYFFVIQPKHQKVIESTICRMMESPWKDHFIAL